jgi:hypothetical protein
MFYGWSERLRGHRQRNRYAGCPVNSLASLSEEGKLEYPAAARAMTERIGSGSLSR